MTYLSQPSQICSANSHFCDGSLLGPIKNKTQTSEKSDLIFYFANKEKLETSRYDFHISKMSDELHLNKSYVYLLYNIKNAPVGQLEEFLDQQAVYSDPTFLMSYTQISQKEQIVENEKLDNFRIQQSLGT